VYQLAVAEPPIDQNDQNTPDPDRSADELAQHRVWYGLEFQVDLSPNSLLLSVLPQLAEGRGRTPVDPAQLLSGDQQALVSPFPLSGDEIEILQTLRRCDPLVHRIKGYVVRHEGALDLLAMLRGRPCTIETPRTAATPVQPEPIQPVLWADYDEDGALTVQGQYVLPGASARLAAHELEGRTGWTRIGDGFYRAPEPLPRGLSKFFGRRPVRFVDQEIPAFLQKQLPQLKTMVEVDADPRVAEGRVMDAPTDTTVELELDAEDRLVAEVSHQYDDWKLTHKLLSQQDKDKPYLRVGDDWVKVDRKGVNKVKRQLRESGFKATRGGAFHCEPDDVPHVLQQAVPEITRLWNVYVPDEIQGASVIQEPFKAQVRVDMDDERGWLWFDVRYEAGGVSLDYQDVQNLPPDRKYARVGNTWVKVDRRTHQRVRDSLRGRDLKSEGRRLGGPAAQHRELQQVFSMIGTVEHTDAYEKFLNRLTDFQKVDGVPLPTELRATLRPYQQHGYNWLSFLYQYGLNGVLADDMGLGKTLQTLAALARAREQEGTAPSLVVCPTSLVGNWRQEAWKFTPRMRVMSYKGPKRARLQRFFPLCDIVVCSYQMVWRDLDELKDVQWRYIVLDEAQYIKNHNTKMARACKVLSSRSKLAVTGTPVENRLGELWSIFDFLMPAYLGSYNDFRDRYELPIMRSDRRDRARDLQERIQPFVLRRLKEQVATDLPDKIEQSRPCELTGEQVELYREIAGLESRRVMTEVAKRGIQNSRVAILAAITKLKQVCDHPALLTKDSQRVRGRSGKFEAFVELLEEILDAGDKVLVFSQFTAMLDIIRRHLEAEDVGYLYLHGGTRNRDNVVEEFQSDPSKRVFLLSLHAAGVGLNLTAANRVIHYDRWWNPAVENQATDRAHRIGQKRNVFVYKMLTEGTIEEKIQRMQEEKAKLFDSVISVDKNVFKSITPNELSSLFRLDPARWTADG